MKTLVADAGTCVTCGGLPGQHTAGCAVGNTVVDVNAMLGPPQFVPAEPELTLRDVLALPQLARVDFYPDGALRTIEFHGAPKSEKPKAPVVPLAGVVS